MGRPARVCRKEKLLCLGGQVIARWTKEGVQFSKDGPLNQEEIEAPLMSCFVSVHGFNVLYLDVYFLPSLNFKNAIKN